MLRIVWGAVVVAAVCLTGCGGAGDTGGDRQPEMDDVDTTLRRLIRQHQLAGDPAAGRNLPAIDEPLPQLGMKLFFSRSLSGEFETACVSCHHPFLGGDDGLSLPVGVGSVDPDRLGLGREHQSGLPNVERNVPTSFNIGLWDKRLFQDGRLESLGKTPLHNGGDGAGIRTPDVPWGTADPQAGRHMPMAQARFPMTSVTEMRGPAFEAGNGNQVLREHLADRLADRGRGAGEIAGRNDWLAAFRTGFRSSADAETLITPQRIARAISAYMRSQVFTNTPWRAYVQGDASALSPAAKRGAVLFLRDVDEGGAGCANCHSGDFFTDEGLHILATPQIGPGKGDGIDGDQDYGRFRVTGNETERFAFRTPALLNVAVTEPYGHAGAFQTLKGMIRHHLDPFGSVEAYFQGADWCNHLPQFRAIENCNTAYPNAEAHTRQALDALESAMLVGRSALTPTHLSDARIGDLVAFLEALTDPCVQSRRCLAPWVAEPEQAPDDFQLAPVLPSARTPAVPASRLAGR